MVIIHSNEELENPPYCHLGKAECFLCGFVLHFPALCWVGSTGMAIFLHEGCIQDFALRLLRDRREDRQARKEEVA